MRNNINIAVVGLGQIGNYLLNELKNKKKEIKLLTGKNINVVAISAKNKNKKRKFKINKNIFYKNPFRILDYKKIDINEDLTFDEFKMLIENKGLEKDYPDINK